MSAFDPIQLGELTAMLGRAVPPAYCALMDRFPAALATKLYDGGSIRIAEYELFDDPARVVAYNREIRLYPTWGADTESGWSPEHLAIGRDLSGDVIYIDVTSDTPSVCRYLVETGGTLEVAADVATYADMLRDEDPRLLRA